MMRFLKILSVGAVLAAVSWAGGFWLEFGNPSAVSDPAAKGAFAVVRAVGCGHPAKALVTGTAEGIVNGKRQSVPVELIALATPGAYAVRAALPREGVWMLAMTGTYEGRITGALAMLGPEGVDRKSAKLFAHKPTSEQIESSLRTLAAQSGVHSASIR